jgi:hypothetical protein
LRLSLGRRGPFGDPVAPAIMSPVIKYRLGASHCRGL